MVAELFHADTQTDRHTNRYDKQCINKTVYTQQYNYSCRLMLRLFSYATCFGLTRPSSGLQNSHTQHNTTHTHTHTHTHTTFVSLMMAE